MNYIVKKNCTSPTHGLLSRLNMLGSPSFSRHNIKFRRATAEGNVKHSKLRETGPRPLSGVSMETDCCLTHLDWPAARATGQETRIFHDNGSALRQLAGEGAAHMSCARQPNRVILHAHTHTHSLPHLYVAVDTDTHTITP